MNLVERTVQAKHVLEVPITTYQTGVLHYWVTSEEITDLFILDAIGRGSYRARRPYMSLVESNNERMHVGELHLPHDGQWFIVVRNTTDTPIQVQVSFEFVSALQLWAQNYRR